MTRRFVVALLTISIATLIGAGLTEATFRVLERRAAARRVYEGDGGRWVADGRWGWKPARGAFRDRSEEYDARGVVNSLNMNDVPYVPGDDDARTRILALGDSHTWALGIDMAQTWPKLLERRLDSTSRAGAFRVYNGGVMGFNMHQYLLRLIDQGPIVKPDYVVLGFSFSTDLYDLLPPAHGGWIYGNEFARDYFDFDSSGQLTERHWDGSDATLATQAPPAASARVRQMLDRLAVVRSMRRSRLALFIGSHFRIDGETLWPSMDVVVEKDPDPQHEYQWRLFEALLSRIQEETERQHAQLVLVGIPYLPQVYDAVWRVTFAGNPKYSRTAASERVRAFCQSHGIAYVDTLDAFRARASLTGRSLHFPQDGHPNGEGHEAIAETVFTSGLLQPVR